MLLLSCVNSVYILDINRLFIIWSENMFSHSLPHHFAYYLFFCEEDFLVWCSHAYWFVLLLQLLLFGVVSKKSLPRPMSRSFVLSGLMFRSLTHFELIFVSGVKVQFHFLSCGYIVFLPYVEKPILSHECSWLLYEILADCICEGLLLNSYFCFFGPCICYYFHFF